MLVKQTRQNEWTQRQKNVFNHIEMNKTAEQQMFKQEQHHRATHLKQKQSSNVTIIIIEQTKQTQLNELQKNKSNT